MADLNYERLQQLQGSLYQVLQEYPGGIREFDLMKALSAHVGAAYQVRLRGDVLSLFQSHFLLFHCLYLLRDGLRQRCEFDLDIHCLNIQLLPYQATDSNFLALSDSLRDYYLDINHLNNASVDGVTELLGRFWGQYQGQAEHQDAHDLFGLTAPVAFSDLKDRYRRLVMDHHPDRGGATEKLQYINESFTRLKRHYSF